MENNKTGSATVGGTGFVGLLQIAFIVLKLCGVIKWKWLWVLAPTWIGILVSLLSFGVILLLVYINNR